MTLAGMYRLRLVKFPIIYNALIMPQSKFIEVDKSKFVINVPMIIDLLPLSITFMIDYINAFADLSLDN
jgi:hypothetical protein